MDDVKIAKTTIKQEPRDDWLVKHYDVMMVENKSKLIYTLKEGVSAILIDVADSEIYDAPSESPFGH